MARTDLGNWPLSRITPALIARLEAEFAKGRTIKTAAQNCELPPGILRRWLEAGLKEWLEVFDRDVEPDGNMPLQVALHVRCMKARAGFTSSLQDMLTQAGAGKESSPGSAGFQLERLESDDWGASSKLEVTGQDGGPIAVEGRAVVGLADVVSLYLESGQGHLLGLGTGSDGRALPRADEVLSDPSDDEQAADGLARVPGP